MIAIGGTKITKAYLGQTELVNVAIGDKLLLSNEPVEMAFTSETNAPMLAACYAQGWAAHADYMTKAEAAAVTSIGSAFNRNANIVDFDLSCFTGVSSIANGTTYNLTGCTSMKLPTSITKLGNNFMQGAANLVVGVVNEGCTTISNALFSGCTNMELVVLPSTLTQMGYMYKGSNTSLPKWSIIIKATTPPTMGVLGNKALITNIYVPDASVSAYQTALSTYADKILGKSQLPSEYQQYWE